MNTTEKKKLTKNREIFYMTANVLSLVAFIGIILVRVINLKDNTKNKKQTKQ